MRLGSTTFHATHLATSTSLMGTTLCQKKNAGRCLTNGTFHMIISIMCSGKNNGKTKLMMNSLAGCYLQ